ncbi:hypothetical protein ACJMK2_007525 [Sinanodonta woodiana]|uniref:LYR motif-containing protein 7 n=1 Tax=Sinanodonta woodiana TaxID=1069815 RepID=A0ABD3VJ18_SINWO
MRSKTKRSLMMLSKRKMLLLMRNFKQTSQTVQDSDVEDVIRAMYLQIRAKFDTLNKTAFIKNKAKSSLDVKGLNDTRQALFQLAKKSSHY